MNRIAGIFFVTVGVICAQEPSLDISLAVPAGAPLRLYLTQRIPKRLNAPVRARMVSPLYAFDREVVPAGTEVFGTVTRLPNVARGQRTKALLSGDFTPLHDAEVKFTSLRMPDGRQIPIDTVGSSGLNSVYSLHPPKARKQAAGSGGAASNGKQAVKDQIDARVSGLRSVPDLVRGPGKKDMVEDFFWAKLPYHPQFVRSRTRFDAELAQPLRFGSATVLQSSLSLLGSQPSADSMVHARLVTPLDSKTAAAGQSVQAVLDAPLFSEAHKLILPAGTRMDGTVVLAKKAGWFHHAGRLRFTFENVQMPPETLALTSPAASSAAPEPGTLQFRTQAVLKAADGGSGPVKVDGEGGVQAADSKARFLGPAFAAVVAIRSGSGDPKTDSNGSTSQDRNTGGRALGGGSGFGLLGTIAGQLSPDVSSALGYYGLARTLYFAVIAPGPDAEFRKNSAIDVGFSVRKPEDSMSVTPATEGHD
jgi:hypothetical protein